MVTFTSAYNTSIFFKNFSMKSLSHLDKSGKASMVDVGHKPLEIRTAKAVGFIHLQKETTTLIEENLLKKGDVLGVAQIAGIQAAKQTHNLIPLCHPLPLTYVDVIARLVKNDISSGVEVVTEVRCTGQTGVEMEALTAAGIALLTIYDMCKAVDKQMIIEGVRLIEKTKAQY